MPLNILCINLWSLEARTCFTGLLSPRWTYLRIFGQLIRALQEEWLSYYLRTVTSCCEIHSLPLLLHYAISYIRGNI